MRRAVYLRLRRHDTSTETAGDESAQAEAEGVSEPNLELCKRELERSRSNLCCFGNRK